MGLVTVIKCDQCQNTIETSSTTRIEFTGQSEFTMKVYSNGQSSTKYTRLDFCNKNCCKNFVDSK